MISRIELLTLLVKWCDEEDLSRYVAELWFELRTGERDE